MLAIRMISVAGFKPSTFKSWADKTMNYLSSMPTCNLHVLQLQVQCSVQTKRRQWDEESH